MKKEEQIDMLVSSMELTRKLIDHYKEMPDSDCLVEQHEDMLRAQEQELDKLTKIAE